MHEIGIIRTLARYPIVQYIPQGGYTDSEDKRQSLRDSNKIEMPARLEQRIYFVKEEMSIIEARLESIHHEFTLLKMHLQELDQLNSKKTNKMCRLYDSLLKEVEIFTVGGRKFPLQAII